MLSFLDANGLIDHVDPVQYVVRLLIPPGSWLENHPEAKPHLGKLDQAAFTYRWTHPDPGMDRLHKDVSRLVENDAQAGADTATTFYRIMDMAHGREPTGAVCSLPTDRRHVPRLTESWFC